MEDWGDLQAVVRGRSAGEEVFASMMNEQSPTVFAASGFDQGDDLLRGLTRSFETESEDHHHLQNHSYWFHQMPFSPQSFLTTTASSESLPSSTEGEKELRELQKSPEDQPLYESSGSGVSSVSCSTNQVSHASKWRRSRKNDQKKLVQQVAAEDLSSDMWAWRKYGQKPIKGSPYPRSYYKCSSLKGCMARKQVERSISDPSTFIVTYTAEHSHGYPSRKNALAGITRSSKSLTATILATASDEPKLPNSTSDESQKTRSLASAFGMKDDGFFQSEAIRSGQEEQAMLPEDISYRNIFPNNLFSDDEFYTCLGDFEGLLFD